MKLQRSDITELHCIVPMANVRSIAARGILSHEQAEELDHVSVASSEVQERRASVSVPNGLQLHQYANLYIDARNPMMFTLVNTQDHRELCVMRVSADVLETPGVVIADRNAARRYVRFGPSPVALSMIERDLVFADWWNNSDEAKGVRCAEVLVPGSVSPQLLEGAYVSCDEALHRFNALGLTQVKLSATIYEHLFYR